MVILYLIGLIIVSPIIFILTKKGKFGDFLKRDYESNWGGEAFWIFAILSSMFYPLFLPLYFPCKFIWFLMKKFYNFLDNKIQ